MAAVWYQTNEIQPEGRTLNALKDKVVLVTGSSRGIGRVTAREFARQGAKVVITARTAAPRDGSLGSLAEAVADIESVGGTVHAVQANLSDADDAARLAKVTLDKFGGCDFLINNAAFMGAQAYASLDEITLKGWNGVVAVNLTAPLILAQSLLPTMRARGGGVIVNVTSRNGDFATGPGPVKGFAYGATKAALNLMTQRWARDLAPEGIAAIILDPGFTASEIVAARAQDMVSAEVKDEFSQEHMQPMEVPARAILHLCTCPNPLLYAGQIVVAADLVKSLGLF